MRWDELFDDLESQWDAEQRRDLDAEVADRTRRERATLGLHERLVGAVGSDVGATVRSGVRIAGTVVDVGDGWVLLGAPTGHPSPVTASWPALVPLAALVGLTGLTGKASRGGMARSFGLGYALRGLSRDRSVVAVTDVSGASTTGTIDAVWSDAFELSEHPADLPRRAENVTDRRVVPFAALVVVRPA